MPLVEGAIQKYYWGFIDSVLNQMGFKDRWRKWIQGILQSSRASVLINGSPSWEFQCYRGVRQGDPLSPFIFIIAMEALSCFMEKAESLGTIKGIKLPHFVVSLSHLMYADDVMIMGDWDSNCIRNIIRLLRCFYLISGLKMNHQKSKIFGVGVSNEAVIEVSNTLHINHGLLPCTYLGVQVGANMNHIRHWNNVLEVCKGRLSKWKAKTLSLGGRVVLLKAVLDSLPLYNFSLFRAPSGILEQLEKIRRRFFWGGNDEKSKTAWVAWERVINPKDKGGIGLGSLKHMNMSLLLRWWWRYKLEPRSLWRRVIDSIHHNEHAWSFLPIKSTITGVWNAIVKVGKDFDDANIQVESLFKSVPGNGLGTRFWLDSWIGEQPLRYTFPNLFILESNKGCNVAARFSQLGNSWVLGWVWKREPLQEQERRELLECSNLLQSCKLSANSDAWSWIPDQSGAFSIASCRRMLSAAAVPFYPFEWSNLVPKKVNLLAWRSEQDRIPTLEGLLRRKIINTTSLCTLCNDQPENAEHLFISCFFATHIWNKISEWCRIPPIIIFDFRDLLKAHKINGIGSTKKKVIKAIILTTIWTIWTTRNRKIFAGKRPNLDQCLGEIKSLSYNWVTNKAKNVSKEWKKWIDFDLTV